MKKITKQEFDALDLSRPSISTEIKSTLALLEVDEGFIVTRDEWKLNSRPADFFSAYAAQNRIKLTTRILADGSGWAVLRME